LRVFISTGETSGDKHAANLIRALKRRKKDWGFIGIGGPYMSEEGVKIIFPANKLSVIGFQEALTKLKKLRELLKEAVKSATTSDLAILVDNPGFNLRLARSLYLRGIPVVYYIVPQIWAWGSWRIRSIKKYVDLALPILPFEEPYLKRFGIHAHYVGHPILDDLPLEKAGELPLFDQPQIGFFPGSREDEIRRLLPRMKRIMEKIRVHLPDAHFHLSLLSPRGAEFFNDRDDTTVYFGDAHRVILNSHVVVAASGTVSLEAGLLGRPQVVVYVLSDLSWFVATALAKVRNVSLVNILLKKEVVPEYLQRINPDVVAKTVSDLIKDKKRYESIREELFKLKDILGCGSAPEKAASTIINFVEERNLTGVSYP